VEFHTARPTWSVRSTEEVESSFARLITRREALGVQLPAGADPTLCIDPARLPAAAGLLDGSDAPPPVEPNFEAHHSHRATSRPRLKP
jgi:hypothetical protein